MLVLNDIIKSYPQRGTVLNHLDLEAEAGATIAITGPSGSGKTTLLNLIGLLDRPDSGKIVFKGKMLNEFSPDDSAEYRNRNMGFIFQDHLLLPYLTIMENVLLPLFARDMPGNEYEEAKQRAEAILRKTGIEAITGKYPFQVSGGEAQRAALVRALINKPDILLADEPTGSLDPANAEILGNLLREISEMNGTAVILATHSEKLASMMSVVYRLTNGKLTKL